MRVEKEEWFTTWFNTSYYNILYQNRNEKEALEFVNLLVQLIQPTQQAFLLDVGCGNGRHSLAFAYHFKKVVGIDISKNKIEEAKKKSLNNTEFFVHDMRQPFHSQLFDVVFNGFTSFGYSDNEQENDLFFNNMCELVKPKGFFIFDYLNGTAILDKNKSKPLEIINYPDLTFRIERQEKEGFFYKNIVVDDLKIQQNFLFQERVKIYDFKDIEKKLKRNYFSKNYVFGDYQLNPYVQNSSPRIIIIAQNA